MIDSVLLAEITALQRERQLAGVDHHRIEALREQRARAPLPGLRAAVASLLVRLAMTLDEGARDRALAPQH